jgi:phenylalanyl-tRNA synthetase beta chain
MTVPVSLINNYIGTDIPGHQLADSLSKMALSGTLSDDGTLVHVSVPPTRCDVLHTCDVIEVSIPFSL